MTNLLWAAALLAAAPAFPLRAADALETGFRTPPPAARLRCYWWWLNGNVTRQSITRDLEGMQHQGYGGAILIDAGGAEQRGNQPVAAGPLFGSPAWRVLFKHALAEADRLGLEISFNILSGWNLGGPTVKPEQSAKRVTWSQTPAHGPAAFDAALPQPPTREGFYRDIAVLAYPLHHGTAPARRPIQNLEIKGSFKEMGMSTPDTTPLLHDLPSEPGEADAPAREVVVISPRMNSSGHLRWTVPAGDWEILRFGYTSSGSRVSTSSGAWQGLVIDYLDRGALELYWRDVVEPILAEARPYIGRSLKYVVTDSWELDGVNWSPRFALEFQRRRGYNITPFLPVFAGRIIESRDTSVRFLTDLRRTVGDLVSDVHYAGFAELAQRAGLGTHPEAGGPHGAPIDALQALGRTSFPQMEFWAESFTHRRKDEERFFVKEASSAAHIYGKTLVAAEGFTSIGPHWQESLWSNLKPSFDRAVCEGLNRMIWHTFTSSPPEAGFPGQEYFAGTHLNPNVTWWQQSGAFLAYLNRVQFLMQQGRPLADVLYYYGDQVPNFVRLKASDPAHVLPGYDYDVTNQEVLLTRLSVRGGQLTLPDGVAYRVLVLPDLPVMSLAALRKVRDLVAQGATVVAKQRPLRTTGWGGNPAGDLELRRIGAALWKGCENRSPGKAGLVCSASTRDVLAARGIAPDFESAATLDYVHRSTATAEIYFISNQSGKSIDTDALFRVGGKQAEFWDAVSGTMQVAAAFDFTSDGRTRVPLHLDPYGSIAVIFRNAAAAPRIAAILPPARTPVAVTGEWTVAFESPAAKPAPVSLTRLVSWTDSTDPLLRYFSGTATYRKEIEIPANLLAPGQRLWLNLGELRELAEVEVNGHNLGVLWMPPFRADITDATKAGRNQLEVRITNHWFNRVLGDLQLPTAERTTRTNITQLQPGATPLPSGLFGPVMLEVRAAAR